MLNQPKGLISASLSNMGERFGFYTMMTILVFFLQSKFGLSGTDAGIIYATFYFLIYATAFIGGLIADKTQNYKGTILWGILLKIFGHIFLAWPMATKTGGPTDVAGIVFVCVGLFIIAFGSGLFKGNLQALVGQMYDNKKYAGSRDRGFALFYMFINLGAVVAPLAALFMRDWWVESHGFVYESQLPAMCHGLLDGSIADTAREAFNGFAASMAPEMSHSAFAQEYLDIFNQGYHWAFGVSIVANIVSLIIYLSHVKSFPDPAKAAAEKAAAAENDPKHIEMAAAEVKQRMLALGAVFVVVIFFWFAFHQNGVSLNLFARDYTDLTLFGNEIAPELFQSFNPFFVIALTPIMIAIFGMLNKRNMEPSTSAKIAIGLLIAAIAFALLAVVSYLADLPLYSTVVSEGVSSVLLSPWLLIITYFILTISELFISPMGISFVSKVAPPKYQGLMQGGWLTASGVGNQLLFIGALTYETLPIWITWTMFTVVCLASMGTMLAMKNWLNKIAR